MKFKVMKGKLDFVCAIKSWGFGGEGEEEGVEV
jgi:hypothetical protein